LFFRKVEKVVEHGLDSILFHAHFEDLGKLRAAAESSTQGRARSGVIGSRLLDHMRNTMSVPWAAAYARAVDGRFRLVRHTGAAPRATIAASDPLIGILRRNPILATAPATDSAVAAGLAVPVLGELGLEGVLLLGERREAFSPEEIEAVMAVARSVARLGPPPRLDHARRPPPRKRLAT
jgi:GAF domain-containing protein